MTRWYKDKKNEYYYKKAKRERYRSRAAYKLKQLNRKFDLIRRGYKVVDLGAAPGGWMQVTRELVAKEGFVLGVDLEEIEELGFDNVITLKGDFTNKETVQKIIDTVGYVDAVISDASPNISGVWDIDHYRSVELCRSALEIATMVLRNRGNFLVKIFQGREVDDFFKEVKDNFTLAKRTKPKASRGKSAEIYIIGKGFKYPKEVGR